MAAGMSEQPHKLSSGDEHAVEAPLRGTVRIGAGRDSRRREASPHAGKFRFATGVLAGLAVAAVAVTLVILSTNQSSGPGTPWSAWSPPDKGLIAARDIADRLAPLYRVSGVNQLDVITVVNLANPAIVNSTNNVIPGLQVTVAPDPRTSAVTVLPGNTIAYNLCGVGGQGCAIGVGAPSSARLLLLRREALELALYTLKYIPGTQNVLAILPPGHTLNTCVGICQNPPTAKSIPIDIAVLFERNELKPFLQVPLAETLPEQFPPTVDQMQSAPEAGLVSQITASGLFTEQMVQAQDGSTLIELKPLPPQ